MEFLQTRSGGRYRAEPNQTGGGDILDFTSGSDASFDVLGPAVPVAAGDQIIVYNLGMAGADAYAGDNRRAYAGAAGTVSSRRAFTARGTPFPLASPGPALPRRRVAGNLRMRHGRAASLRRYWSYPIAAAQPTPPPAATSALLAERRGGLQLHL